MSDSVTTDSISSNLIISGDCPFTGHENEELVSTLETLWETESIGIQGAKIKTCQTEPKEFVNIKHNGQRYEIELPWKNDCLPIPDTDYNLCYNRLKSMHFKWSKTPNVLREYNSVIQEQLAAGSIDKGKNLASEEENKEDVQYLPHDAVIRMDRETTKLRIVYEGSAKFPGQQLSHNDCLASSPNYIPQLAEVLMKFRWNQIAITAYIEKAFLMISIQGNQINMTC